MEPSVDLVLAAGHIYVVGEEDGRDFSQDETVLNVCARRKEIAGAFVFCRQTIK